MLISCPLKLALSPVHFMSLFSELHQSFPSPPFACWLYPNTTMVLDTSLAQVSFHSNNREEGLISWLVFQAGRHLAPAATQLSVDLLSSLSTLCTGKHFPKPCAVLQMPDLFYLLSAPGVVSVSSGLACPVPFSMAYFGFSIMSAVSEHSPSAIKFVLG